MGAFQRFLVSKFSWVALRSNLPLVLLIIANLVIALFTFQDYGLSWDEPLFYKYADAVGYAYSIQPRLAGTFDIQNAYGPSASDHAIYGPAYLLIGRNLVYLFERISAVNRQFLWHLVNFITSQVGIILLYLLCLRWVSKWAAFASALLFSTQPLLWGHAFINPKDIPFLVFFLAALYSGLRFVDRIKSGRKSIQEAGQPIVSNHVFSRRRLILIGLISFILIMVLLLLNPLIEGTLQKLLGIVYHASHDSLWWRAFHVIAEDADKMGLDYYAGKLSSLYHWLRIGLLVILTPFFLIAVCFLIMPAAGNRFWYQVGLWIRSFVPADKRISFWKSLKYAAIPGILLGMATSIRVLGLLVGFLVVLYFLIIDERHPLHEMLVYFAIAVLTIFITWPYLWDSPIRNFIEVFRIISNNAQIKTVLFNGVNLSSSELPRSYLPTLLAITLTEPVWFLFFAGLVVAIIRILKQHMTWRDFLAPFLWFLIPFIYVILFHPPMYDGFRHFLFILPPVFIMIAILFDQLVHWLRKPILYWALLVILVTPGVIGIVSLHPYEYAYYNIFVGGISGAYRRYENDYWLTCYREAMQQVDQLANRSPNVYVMRQPNLAAIYAVEGVNILPYASTDRLQSGDIILLSTRNNRDLTFSQDSDIKWTIGRQGADYCVVKQVR